MSITTFKIPDTFSESGNVTMISGSDAISQCLKLMTMTSKNELLGIPDYGSNLEAYRLEPNIEIIEDMITEDIVQSAYNYDKRVKITQGNVTVTRQGEKVFINTEYYLNSLNSTFSTTIELRDEGDNNGR